jgi:uncharacterized membrane protein HdeD (DUF308 family)
MGTFVSGSSPWLEPVGPGRWHTLIWSACAVLLGLLLLGAPVLSALAIVTIIAAFWLVGGAASVIAAVFQRGDGWGWRVAGGVLSILAGLVVLANPLFSMVVAVEVLLLFLAVSAIVVGCATLFWSHSVGSVILGLVLIVVGVLLMLASFHILTLIGVIQAIGLLCLVGGLANGIAAAVTGRPIARI